MCPEQERGTGSAVSNVEFTIRLVSKFLKNFAPSHRPFCDEGIEHIRAYRIIGYYEDAVLLLQCLGQLIERHAPVSKRTDPPIELLHGQRNRNCNRRQANGACN